jgi:uncharacterized protein YbjQ (UPF0145 family)
VIDWPLILLCVALLVATALIAVIWLQTHDARWRARHAQALDARERELVGMIADGVGLFRDGVDEARTPCVVVGESALSTRYFGPILPDTRSKFRLQSADAYAMLCQLARREAVVRMLEAARSGGFNAVCDVSIEATDVGHALNRAQRAMVVVTATGTAYRVR